MKERLTTLALAIAAVLAVWLLLAPKPDRRVAEHSRPVSTEARPDGLAAAARWIADGGIDVRSLRGRYGELVARSAPWPAHGNVLVTHVPHELALRATELVTLQNWLRRGNTLIVVAALADTPRWAAPGHSTSDLLTDLRQLSGLAFESASDDGRRARPPDPRQGLPLDVPRRVVIRPDPGQPLTAGVGEVAGWSDFPAGAWRSLDYAPRIVLGRTAAAADGGDGGVATAEGEGLWLVARGTGRVIVVGLGSVFSNRALAEPGNAQLLARLLAATLEPGGAVIFDDAHQGLRSLYTPSEFARDPRLGWSVAILLGLWFAWVLGVQRLAPPPAPARRPDERELIEGAAGLYARRLPSHVAAARLLDHALGRLRLGRTANGEVPWAELARRRPDAAAALAEARTLADRAAAGRRIDLRRLRRALLTLEGSSR